MVLRCERLVWKEGRKEGKIEGISVFVIKVDSRIKVQV